MKTTEAKLRELIAELDGYIRLFGEEAEELIPLAYAHGWRSTRYQAGAQIRKNIARLRKQTTVKVPRAH